MIANSRYKQLKNPLYLEQQTDREIRTDLQNKLLKYSDKKYEVR